MGESHYQDALERIAGGRTDEIVEIGKVAMLIFEDSNPHDNQAVCVQIEGQTVGYLPRNTARSLRAKAALDGLPYGTPFQCAAQIRGGGDRGERDQGNFGVWLDFSGD